MTIFDFYFASKKKEKKKINIRTWGSKLAPSPITW